MDSFLPTEQTAFLVFFNICLLLIMYMLMKRASHPPYAVSASNRNVVILLMFVFTIFSFWGTDWFSYFHVLGELKTGGRTNIEDVYFWIAQNLSPNYLVFRMVIWGSSLFLLLHMFKRLSIPTNLAIFFFCSIYIIWFSYARVTLAMVLVYYGISVLYKPYKNKIISILLGVSSIVCASFFHKSAGFGIIVALLTIIFNKFDRKSFVILLLCYPILIYLVQSYLPVFLSVDLDASTGGLEAGFASGQNYLNKSEWKSGPGVLIQLFLERLPHFLLAFVSYQFIKSKFYQTCPNDVKAFIRLQFFVLLLSSVFAFELGVNTKVVFSRFMRFSVIPSCILLSYYYSVRYKFRYTRAIFYLAFMGTIYALVYAMYNAYVGAG